MKKNTLHNIKSTGFKTPKNYFDTVEDKFFERLSKEDALNNIETTGFKVPEDYFETIEDNVFSKIKEENIPVIKLSHRKTWFAVASIAACLVLLFSVFYNNSTSEEITVEMVETYLENRDLDSYELAELLSDASMLEEDFTITTTPYEEENLEDYLLENVDLETYLE